MNLTGNIFSELNRAFTAALRKSEVYRLGMHSEFAAFYNNDYEAICGYLREATLNNPFSEKTLKELRFRHVNITGKIISRITSGIFTKDPVITLNNAGENEQKLLDEILLNTKFIRKVKEAFRKAVYFNIAEAQAIWDNENKKLRIDVITPDNYTVETGNDYLEKRKIAVRKADENGEIFWSIWTPFEHYIVKDDEIIAPQNNSSKINPFTHKSKNIMPFAVLRIDEGCDYFGEPNWNIFLHQKNLDIRLTDLNETELKTLHQIYLGVNTNFTDGESFRPGDFKQINNVKEDDKDPRIESVIAGVDYASIRENIDWHNKMVLGSEGLSPSSASTELKAESGAAKAIDELELYERREEYKTILFHFMNELLIVTRAVWNYYNPANTLDENKTFDIRFSESKFFESPEDRKKRYDMALEYGYKDNIDITAEELEISEDEAKEVLSIRKERKSQLNN